MRPGQRSRLRQRPRPRLPSSLPARMPSSLRLGGAGELGRGGKRDLPAASDLIVDEVEYATGDATIRRLSDVKHGEAHRALLWTA